MSFVRNYSVYHNDSESYLIGFAGFIVAKLHFDESNLDNGRFSHHRPIDYPYQFETNWIRQPGTSMFETWTFLGAIFDWIGDHITQPWTFGNISYASDVVGFKVSFGFADETEAIMFALMGFGS